MHNKFEAIKVSNYISLERFKGKSNRLRENINKLKKMLNNAKFTIVLLLYYMLNLSSDNLCLHIWAHI